ncbi:MAG: flagellin [Armatimonadetes bacterium]|nr:flagellin [Armatimonadota bacterium]MDW8153984.1 flagellin [Armatimonadota bacterium]
MGLRINQNIAALNAHRNLVATDNALSKSLERLSSGFRINRSADDAAGLALSEKLRAQVRGVAQAIRNAQDGVSMIQTAEGALNEVHSMLQRMRELAVQAANDTLTTEDRAAILGELQALQTEIDSIVDRTTFNGKQLLNGSLVTTVDAGSDLEVGSTVTDGTDSGHIIALDVSGARPGETYTFSYDSSTGRLTLTRSSDNAQQYVTLSGGLSAGQRLELNFSALGVKLTVTTTGGFTDAGAIGNSFDTRSITTASGTGSANMQIGPNSTHSFSVSFSDVRIVGGTANQMTGLGLAIGALQSAIGTNDNSAQVNAAKDLIDAVDDAISYVNGVRSGLGAVQNRLEHAIANLGVQHENLTASESRIRDVDMAQEMVRFTRNQILLQAGTAMLAQANAAPQVVLQLLR